MNNRLRRATRSALQPNAIILGAAACLFGWSLAEAFGPYEGHFTYLKFHYAQLAGIFFGLLVAAAALATRKPLGNLIAAALSAPLSALPLQSFFIMGFFYGDSFLSAEHLGRWVRQLSYTPPADWLMTALATAILSSATVATLRQTPPRP